MKREYLRKFQFPLLIALGTWPISALGMGFIDAGLLSFSWAFPLAYLILAWAAILVPGKWRLLFGVAGAAVLVGIGMMFGQWKVLIISLVYSGMLLWSLQIGGWPRQQEVPPFWIYVGAAVQAAAQVALIYAENAENLDLSGAAPGILFSFLGFVLLVMLSLNRGTLEGAAMGRHRASGSMRWKNLLLILCLFLAALLAALSPLVGTSVSAVLAVVRGLMQRFSRLFGGEAQTSEFEAGEEQASMNGGEASQIALLLWDIASVIAQAAVIALFVYAAYRLLRRLVRHLGRLLENVNRYAANVAEDYEDEITDTREDRDLETGASRRRKRNPFGSIAGLTPGQRIRREYLRLRQAHRRWGDASTARENLPEDMAELYERARYSDEPITDQEAAYFREESKDM